MPKEISVEELKKQLAQDPNLFLIDCRESDEFGFCCIAGAKNIPLSQFEERAEKEIPPGLPVVIHCHHGGRSLRACLYLEELGYEDVTNVKGGIDAWSLKIDPKVPRY